MSRSLSELAKAASPLVGGHLRSLFLALSHAALASTLGAGCDSDTSDPDDPEGPDRSDTGTDGVRDGGTDAGGRPRDAGHDASLEPGFAALTCTEGRPELPGDLKTARPIEYLSLRQAGYDQRLSPDGGLAQPRFMTELAHQGLPCAGLTDPAPCRAQLATASLAPPCSGSACAPNWVVLQEASTVSQLRTREELSSVLGSVDTPADAVLLALFDNRTLCDTFDAMLGDPSIAATADGYEIHAAYESCGSGKFRDRIAISASGTLTVLEHTMLAISNCAIGRRPDGLQTPVALSDSSRRGAYLAEAAHLEAASVHAFDKLTHELSALDAPEALIEAAREAREDELRHARDVAALARAHGAEPPTPSVHQTRLRSPFELALDNASEGCVRETYGALLATYQASCASDPRVRAIMETIAEDETRHAALSWSLQAWLEARLSTGELAEVAAARSRAWATLQGELAEALPHEDRRALGLPSPELAAHLLAQLGASLPNSELPTFG